MRFLCYNWSVKNCGRCKAQKELSEFNKNSSKKDGLQSYCKTCRKEVEQEWYQDNKDLQKQRSRVSRLKVKQFVFEHLKSHPCVDCGEEEPVVLQFDHLDKTNKLANISDAANLGWGLKRVKDEIEKCEVRCANCHLKRTAIQFNWYKDIIT